MAEENAAPEAHSIPPQAPLKSPGDAVEPSGPGAAIATWGPLAMLALLIVVFRVGGDDASARAAPAPSGNAGDAIERAAPPAERGEAGLSLPPLILPGSEKLIEELSASPWRLDPPGGSVAPETGARAVPPGEAPSPGAIPAMPPHMMPGMGQQGGAWGMHDPASGYWSQPPTGYPGYGMPPGPGYGPPPYGPSYDPYWWAQGPMAPPPEPTAPAPRE